MQAYKEPLSLEEIWRINDAWTDKGEESSVGYLTIYDSDTIDYNCGFQEKAYTPCVSTPQMARYDNIAYCK